MTSGISIEITEPNENYLGSEIRAWNGRFSATTHLYLDAKDFLRVADCVAGFPNTVPDRREFSLGHQRGGGWGGGYCRMVFRTVAAVGAVDAEVEIEEDLRYSESTVTLLVPVEAAAVERFVAQLRQLARGGSGKATMSVDE
jgi:hypothetical protein